MLYPKKFNSKKRFRIYEKIFEKAGVLREVYVNSKTVVHFDLSLSFRDYFERFLLKRNTKHQRQLKKAIQNFDIKRFRNTAKEIKKLVAGINDEKINAASHLFLTKEKEKVEQLLEQVKADQGKLHLLRKEIKLIDANVILINQLIPDNKLEKLLHVLDKGGKLIGHWHDNVILKRALTKFVLKNQQNSQEIITPVTGVHAAILINNKLLFKKIRANTISVIEELKVS